MKVKELPSLDYLNECFILDETSPSGLTWKLRPQCHFPTHKGWACHKTRDASKPAGSKKINDDGKEYFQIKVSGTMYLVHRIVYSLHNNEQLSPTIEIDHRDSDGLNNRPCNLRKATSSENKHNAKLMSRNTSGEKGIDWSKKANAFRGRVTSNGVCYHLGYSPSKEIMIGIVREFRTSLHKDFRNHG